MDDFNFSKCHTANIIVGYWNRLIKTPKRLIKAYTYRVPKEMKGLKTTVTIGLRPTHESLYSSFFRVPEVQPRSDCFC